MIIRRIELIGVAVLCVLALAGCGEKAEPAAAPEPIQTAEPVPTPMPTPEPTPEPELPAGKTVTVDGTELASGSVIKDGTVYIKLSEAAQALGAEPEIAGDEVSFVWRRRDVNMAVDSAKLTYGEKEAELTAPLTVYRDEIWVPVESVCDALEIGLLYDEEFDHLYCTPGAGDWELKEGYKVPICMYHAVCDDLFEYMLYDMCVRPADMEEQLKYLTDNGYDTIFFDDLEHIDEYDKPIILTYDDGYDCLYDNLFPLLKKYNAKVVIYIITDNVENGRFHSLSKEQIIEMEESGLVSFQSHTVHHDELIYLDEEELRSEYYDSKLYITRLTGKEPFGIAYPYGMAYPKTMEVAMEYYRFGVRMGTFPYYTGDDPSFMWRILVDRDLYITAFANKIDLVDPKR